MLSGRPPQPHRFLNVRSFYIKRDFSLKSIKANFCQVLWTSAHVEDDGVDEEESDRLKAGGGGEQRRAERGNKLQMKLNSVEFSSAVGGIRATRNRELDITSIFICRLCRSGFKAAATASESHTGASFRPIPPPPPPPPLPPEKDTNKQTKKNTVNPGQAHILALT